MCAGHICYLGHIIGYTELAGSQLYLSYGKLWEMILISIQKSMDLESVGLTRWVYQAACPHLCWGGVQPALHTWPWLYLCFCLCSAPNSSSSYNQQEPGAHGRDLVTRRGRMLEKLKTKFNAPQKADRFCLSVTVLAFFGSKSSLQEWVFKCPPNSEDIAF